MDQTDDSNFQTSTEIKIYNSWDDFNIKPELLRSIYTYGFENPSEIQKRAIDPIISRKDIIAQAQSGSGKTGTFSIATLQIIDVSVSNTQAIILAPTHELAKQISIVIEGLSSFMTGLRISTIYGGTSIQDTAESIQQQPPHIIVGCPGRIFDMIRRKHINVFTVKLLVIDEADEMLSIGFKSQIYNIFQYFSDEIQVALFSASIPPEVLELSKKFMRTPLLITVAKEKINLKCIEQQFVALYDDYEKFDIFKKMFSMISINQCIIYCNTVGRVIDLQSSMQNEGFSVCCIHSSMDKSQRENTFSCFRNGTYRVLISSDITARGIDIQQVSTVINFDIPKSVHTYLHRIGRSGRWGRKGLAINFVTKRDIHLMKNIEDYYKISMTEFNTNNL
jgi:superfamily II DNA/RNA helicase